MRLAYNTVGYKIGKTVLTVNSLWQLVLIATNVMTQKKNIF